MPDAMFMHLGTCQREVLGQKHFRLPCHSHQSVCPVEHWAGLDMLEVNS